MRERKNNEERKLEGKRQQLIAETEEIVRKKNTKTSISVPGKVKQNDIKK